MKICILTTGHSPTDSRIFHKEAKSLLKKYKDITIVAPYERGIHEIDGIKVVGITKPKNLKDRFLILEELIDRAIEEKADIYHFHDFEIIYKAKKIKKKLPNCKIIYDVHEHYPDMANMSNKIPKVIRPLSTFFVDKTELIISRGFDYIITADEAVEKRFKVVNKNVEVIHNFTQFIPEKKYEVEKKYDMIYQGGITIERGALQILKTVNIIKNKYNYKDIKMIFVGPFGYDKCEDILKEYIKDNNLEKNIKFTGKVKHAMVREYMYKSKIGLVTLLPLPKYFKNIPTKQFEYMSCGIPVIGSYMPPIKDYITAYNSGLVVNPEDENELAENVIHLLKDDKLRDEMGNNGIYSIKEKFNWKKEEEKLWKIYEELCNREA
ncbi:glycosyltransferase family 4 protein [Clostridium senegalense]|uniref:glycosyltransferase family 4 protein n=1 Tax=Clostridium senegalense TaxID=1465809 RepID=UPI000289A41F|nr:glycosyltransferase family 4 protein [Clostridium senegalense]